MLFLAVFYAVWPIQFAAFVVPTVPSNYWIYVLAAIIGPFQGFLNALVVFRRDKKSIQRRVSQFKKKLLSWFSAKFTNNGSSEEDLVKREEAAQLGIGVGHLDRLEEEEKTPEYALNGKGDVSDEALDTSNDGLLEHAMSSGLLNEDDLEMFRRSIERIQSGGLLLGE